MARQKGIFKVEGTLGGVTFYDSQDGMMAREKGGISKERIAKDPSFARTRENGEEFARAASAGKVIRDSLRAFMANASDNRVVARMSKAMFGLLKLDSESIRGKRSPALGLATGEGKALLKGFNFNLGSVLGSVILKPVKLDTANGQVSFGELDPKNEIYAPVGATHAKFTAAVVKVDLATGITSLEVSPSATLLLSSAPTTVGVTPVAMPSGDGVTLYLLKVEFTQLLNGQHYGLNNGAYNSLSILEVL